LGKTPAPYAYLSREPTGKEVGCYGPLVGRGRADDAVRRLNDWFKLRDCPSTQRFYFADQPELFPADRSAKCLRYEIGTCLGPCGGGCTRKEYGANVRAAKNFLDGKDKGVLDGLAKQMAAAAAELRFEQAMAVRDRLQSLTWLADRLAFLRSARRANSFVYPLETPAGTVWYLIHHGEVQGAIRAPATAGERAAAAEVIEAAFAVTAPPGGIDDKCVDSVLLVTAWFRKYRDEKAKLLTRAAALALCGEPLAATA
jgi:excinuclease ABC subunit C